MIAVKVTVASQTLRVDCLSYSDYPASLVRVPGDGADRPSISGFPLRVDALNLRAYRGSVEVVMRVDALHLRVHGVEIDMWRVHRYARRCRWCAEKGHLAVPGLEELLRTPHKQPQVSNAIATQR